MKKEKTHKRPCPKCGGKNTWAQREYAGPHFGKYHRTCNDCGQKWVPDV